MQLLRTVCLVGLAALTAGCYSTPARIYHSLDSSDLYAVNPVDIAILPIEDASAYGAASDVLESLRAALTVDLIGRGYTPLATPQIDRANG